MVAFKSHDDGQERPCRAPSAQIASSLAGSNVRQLPVAVAKSVELNHGGPTRLRLASKPLYCLGTGLSSRIWGRAGDCLKMDLGVEANQPVQAGLVPGHPQPLAGSVALFDFVRIVRGGTWRSFRPVPGQPYLPSGCGDSCGFPARAARIGLLLPDLARNRLPTAHGIEGHDASRQDRHVQPDGRGFRGACGPGCRSRTRSCRPWAWPSVSAKVFCTRSRPSSRAASCRAQTRPSVSCEGIPRGVPGRCTAIPR